jgi:LysM repeat protein
MSPQGLPAEPRSETSSGTSDPGSVHGARAGDVRSGGTVSQLASGAATVCPYLFVPGASWRASRPLREHRCLAVTPSDAPAMETQRALCLTAAHVTCPRFEAAVDARRARWIGTPESLAAFEARVDRRVPRVTAVTLDRPSAIAGPLSLLGGSRRLARIALAAAMIGAAGLLLAARFAGGGVGGDVRRSPEPTGPAAAASPTEAVVPSSASPSLPATSTPSPSPAASDAAGTTPTPTSKPKTKPTTIRRYKVRPGDTLSGIAKRFGTTVAVLKRLNSISDASLIRPGQVLRVP